jgi:galactose mutarotase-like enzyme
VSAPEIVVLQSGVARAELAPAAGGRLMRWSIGERPVIHWPESADWSAPAKIRGGNPLLFPFIARTFLDGKIGSWRDPHGQIRPAPMHGLVRAAPFMVTKQAADCLALEISWNPGMGDAWPFPFVFSVEYTLAGEGLEVAFTVANSGAEEMPYSVGNHFYFEVPAPERGGWRLGGDFRSFARQDAEGKIVTVPPPRSGGILSDADLVDLFHIGPSSDGTVLRHVADGREVAFGLMPDDSGANPWYAVTTWTESAASDFYCVEPWTALPDAVNSGKGLRWLKPAAQETLRLRLTARNW